MAGCVKYPQPPELQRQIIPTESKPAVNSPSPVVLAGGWTKSVDKSAFDDSKSVFLGLIAEADINGWPGKTFRPALILRCKEGKTDAILRTGMTGVLYHGEGYNGDATTTRARYDKDQAWEYVMLKSTDGEAYFFRNPIEEIKTMEKKKSLVIEFTPFNSNAQEIRFDLGGLTEPLQELRSTCRW